ncbi:hypothetical protein BJF84_24055 [Rhodococcus sp. CUA-806]|nr:hypothetical protein BJF84_24055 [Rhodococcus sp. CUA-806]
MRSLNRRQVSVGGVLYRFNGNRTNVRACAEIGGEPSSEHRQRPTPRPRLRTRPNCGVAQRHVAAHRAANAALAASITAAAHFYDTRINDIDPSTIPARLDVERITHTSAIAEIAAATTRPAGTVETHLNIWWGSRPVYREMFTAGTISLEVLRTIRDHTLGAPATVIAALEPDIITATRHFTPTRLGKEIDA